MAKVCLLKGRGFREVYAVERPVGPGCINQRDDVQLVQLLLKIATETRGDSAGFQPPGEPMIEPDGFFGPRTQKYIKYFQDEVDRRQNRKLVEQDSVVDPVRTGASRSSISNTMYTILALNAAMRTRRGDAFQIENEPKFPTELMSSLFVAW